MALFSKEPENTLKSSDAMKPTPAPQPVGTAVLEETAASPRIVPVAAQPSLPAEGRAYLDKGSKVSGKLFFEGPLTIDGQVDGEISANGDKHSSP